MKTKREQFVEVARAEIGTVEGPKNNETKYGKFTGHDFQIGRAHVWTPVTL